MLFKLIGSRLVLSLLGVLLRELAGRSDNDLDDELVTQMMATLWEHYDRRGKE